MSTKEFYYYKRNPAKEAISMAGCSLSARGLWTMLEDYMHFCRPYGFLAMDDAPIEPALIAKRCAIELSVYESLIGELIRNGVTSRNNKGMLFSQSLVTQDLERKKGRRNGLKGGNPALCHSDVDNPPGYPTSISISNSSPNYSEEGMEGEKRTARKIREVVLPEGFQRWWAAWPPHERKIGKPKCLDFWFRHGLEKISARVIACLEKQKSSSGWKKDGGEFIPLPMTWLNREPWETDVSDLESKPKISSAQEWQQKGKPT